MVRFDPPIPRKYLLGHLLWFLSWVGVTAVALWLSPNTQGHGTHRQLGLPPCTSIVLWGRPCPSCGLTTSFTASAHGQWDLAFHAHPMGPIIYGLFTISAWACGYGYLRSRRLNTDSRAFNVTLVVALSVFILYGIVRFSMYTPWSSDHPSVQRLKEKAWGAARVPEQNTSPDPATADELQ